MWVWVIQVVLLLSILSNVEAVCDRGWKEFRAKCYKNFDAPNGEADFGKSKKYCKRHDAKLPEPRTSDENNSILSAMPVQFRDANWWEGIFLGAMYYKDTHDWKWTDDSKVSYTNWKVGEPGGKEVCLQMTNNGLWNDMRCGHKAYFVVCEKSAQTQTTGQWSQWGPWSPCPVTCGGGIHVRSRTCDNPPCGGAYDQIVKCGTAACPVTAQWTEWGRWSACSVTCGGGIQVRSRTCDNPPCVGPYEQQEKCGTATCPVNGQWSKWGVWSTCAVTCGGSQQVRNRACDQPVPGPGGLDCVGLYKEHQRCGTVDCPVNGQWSEWGPWSVCPVTCGGDDQFRNRTCDQPAPSNGGLDCARNKYQNQRCGTAVCPVNGQWSEWGKWSVCAMTCGGDVQLRTRTCDQPLPGPGGLDCVGSRDQQQECATAVCPAPPVNIKAYEIITITSNIPDAGTDETINFKLSGMTTATENHLKSFGKQRFQQGGKNTAMMAIADASPPTGILFSTHKAKWHLHHVTVKDLTTNQLYTAKCACWIDANSAVHIKLTEYKQRNRSCPENYEMTYFNSKAYRLFQGYAITRDTLGTRLYWAGVQRDDNKVLHRYSDPENIILTLPKWTLKEGFPHYSVNEGNCGAVQPTSTNILYMVSCYSYWPKTLCNRPLTENKLMSRFSPCYPSWVPYTAYTKISPRSECESLCEADIKCLGLSILEPNCFMYLTKGNGIIDEVYSGSVCTCVESNDLTLIGSWKTRMKQVADYVIEGQNYPIDFCEAAQIAQPNRRPKSSTVIPSTVSTTISSALKPSTIMVQPTDGATNPSNDPSNDTSNVPSTKPSTKPTLVSSQKPQPGKTATIIHSTPPPPTTHIIPPTSFISTATYSFKSTRSLTTTNTNETSDTGAVMPRTDIFLSSSTMMTPSKHPYSSVSKTTPFLISPTTTHTTDHTLPPTTTTTTTQTTPTRSTQPPTTQPHMEPGVKPDYCKCVCVNYHPPRNETMKQKQKFTDQILANITRVSLTNSTRFRLSKISVNDDRPTSTSIGILGIFMLSSVAVVLLVADARVLWAHAKVAVSNILSVFE